MQINNLARDNLHDKLGILSELVTDEFWPWFANYMVVKRAAQVGDTATPHPFLHAGTMHGILGQQLAVVSLVRKNSL